MNKIEFGWVVALKRGREVEYYNEHYGMQPEGFIPSKSLIGQITKWILMENKQIERAMWLFDCDYALYTILDKKQAYTLNETYYYMFKSWCFHAERKLLNELTDGQSDAWFDEMKEWLEAFDKEEEIEETEA